MGILHYEVNVNDLDERFIAAVKALFKDKEIVITVQEADRFKNSKGTQPTIGADKKSDSSSLKS